MASTQRHTHGRLVGGVTNRASGRKIDTWTFHGGDATSKLGRGVEIAFEVTLLRSMEVVVDTLDIPRERWQALRGTDISELHAMASQAARAEFDLRNSLEWSDWLEIAVTETSRHERRDREAIAQAQLSYRKIARVETPDGTAYTVNGNGALVKFPEPTGVCREPDGLTGTRRAKPGEEVRAGQGLPAGSAGQLSALLEAVDHRPAETQFAYLPDTPQNRAGLDAIIAAIGDINLRLQQFLDPARIGETLRRVQAGSPLLLGGGEAPKPAKPATRPR